MRGTPRVPHFAHQQLRIIPADAGNTRYQSVRERGHVDHPRGCGEHCVVLMVLTESAGSSPRMRGTRCVEALLKTVGGIIPADAGNTIHAIVPMCVFQDHPRGCGEHITRLCLPCRLAGSSPRMRGTPCGITDNGTRQGIIPADAGNTWNTARQGQSASGVRDHPRGCGEHSLALRIQPRLLGSSPRMRGTQGCGRARYSARRIIPADAGNTRLNCR